MNLVDIQKRFDTATEKEYWSRLHDFLCSDKKESVAQGMNLLENLDEEVYYDGVCSFLEDDGKGNWTLNALLSCENELALKVEILRMVEENVGYEIKKSFEKVVLMKCLLVFVER